MSPRKSAVGRSGAKHTSRGSVSAVARKRAPPPSGSRTARKHVNAHESTAGSRDHEELRSSPRRKTTDPPSSVDTEDVSTEEEADVQASLLAPRSKGSRENAPASASKAISKKMPRTSRRAPVSEGISTVAKKASKIKQSKSTTGTTEDSEDEGPARSVRSTSARGYTWDAERIEIKPEDLDNVLKRHPVIKTTLERKGVTYKVKFKPGNLIFVLPDPAYLPPRSEEIDQSELADDDWWVAQVDSCYSLPQDSETDLGVLKVTWMYSKDDVPKLKYLHDGFKTKLFRYRMDENERIASDHYDFIGIDSYAGQAEGMYHYLTLRGLSVPDDERLKPPHLRAKLNKPKVTELVGWTLKSNDNNAKYYASLDVDDADADDTQNLRAPNSSASAATEKAPKKAAAKKKPSSTGAKRKV